MAMSDDYLWDGSGDPDPAIVQMEKALAQLRHRAVTPRRTTPNPWAALVAAAAAVALVWATLGRPVRPPEPLPGYLVEGLDGMAVAFVGNVIDSGEAEARLDLGPDGDVTLEPHTRVRVVDAGVTHHKLFLERGAIVARIGGGVPARKFQVGTPAGLSVDLGCVYRIEVNDEGVASCEVTSGQVAFETLARRVVVPAGASCTSHPTRGPSTPVWDDAAPDFLAAIVAFDAGQTSMEAVTRVCATDRAADSLSLWHLLDVLSGTARRRVARRLAELVPLPAGVTLAKALADEPAARDAWQDAIEATWW
jgi:hypothetical protein